MKRKFKIVVDLLMTITLLLLMSYQMLGRNVHEWIGVGIFLLNDRENCFEIHTFDGLCKSVFHDKIKNNAMHFESRAFSFTAVAIFFQKYKIPFECRHSRAFVF